MKKLYCTIALMMSMIMIFAVDVKSESKAYSILQDNSAKSYVVIDDSGNVLLEKNCNDKREVASICKLMTTLLTLEYIDNGSISLNDTLTASNHACDVEGSQAFLDAGSDYLVSDLLKSVIVASANDSAIVLAEGIGGNENNFVSMMNIRAKELGMTNTKYANSTGLSEGEEQYSTALDTAKLLKEVSKYETYKNDCKIWMDTLIHPSGRETELVNTNRLIKYYPNCQTGKTGFTDEAGYCLSSTALKNDLKLTCVVLGCDSSADRFSESVELYNYAYANFVSEKIVDSNELIEDKIKVVGGKKDSLLIKPSEDYLLTTKIGADNNYTIEYELPKEVKAQVLEGEKIGSMYVLIDGEIVKEIDVVSAENIEKQNYKDIMNKVIDKFGFIN